MGVVREKWHDARLPGARKGKRWSVTSGFTDLLIPLSS
jgi:hypothetical protein